MLAAMEFSERIVPFINSGDVSVFCLSPMLVVVKKSHVLIRVSFNFPPFKLKLELWEHLRVKVTKSKDNNNRSSLPYNKSDYTDITITLKPGHLSSLSLHG